jgi:metallo-beta-lactamase family protein
VPEILFHGAAGEVTGSHHLIHTPEGWIAMDCGMFHGRRAETEAKNRAWPVPPNELRAVVLSHAHIDHTGRLPRLVRDGFEGDVYCTPPTRDLCAIMLADSAKIQEEDVQYVNKKRARKGLEPVEALYTYRDALRTMRLIHSVPIARWSTILPGVRVRFNEAGHMLGSAGLELRFGQGDSERSLYFTGDIGRYDKPILRDPHRFPQVDTVICESTYGNRTHEPVEDAKTVLTDVVNRTVKRGGKVVIPAFSVGRTQTIVYFLHEQMVAGNIPHVPVFVDSPLSVNATQVFRMHPECYDAEALDLQRETSDILGSHMITYVKSVEESKAIHRQRKPAIIISASGMCEFGRIRHHIKNNVRRAKSTILIPGFQAEHTLGRRLADGAESINLFHQKMKVEAEVVQLHGFSGHADSREMLSMLKPLQPGNPRIYLVHGERDQSEPFAGSLRSAGFSEVTVAEPGLRVTI